MRPFLDKASPEVWKAAQQFSQEVSAAALARGLSPQEIELIAVRASQLNGCAFCLDLHGRRARESGVPQQKLDVLPAWRETDVYTPRESAVLAVVEAVTRMPLSEEGQADLFGAEQVLGTDMFTAAEWVAISINTFNRASILSRHPLQPRGLDGKILR